eukprot:g6357.t1
MRRACVACDSEAARQMFEKVAPHVIDHTHHKPRQSDLKFAETLSEEYRARGCKVANGFTAKELSLNIKYTAKASKSDQWAHGAPFSLACCCKETDRGAWKPRICPIHCCTDAESNRVKNFLKTAPAVREVWGKFVKMTDVGPAKEDIEKMTPNALSGGSLHPPARKRRAQVPPNSMHPMRLHIRPEQASRQACDVEAPEYDETARRSSTNRDAKTGNATGSAPSSRKRGSICVPPPGEVATSRAVTSPSPASAHFADDKDAGAVGAAAGPRHRAAASTDDKETTGSATFSYPPGIRKEDSQSSTPRAKSLEGRRTQRNTPAPEPESCAVPDVLSTRAAGAAFIPDTAVEVTGPGNNASTNLRSWVGRVAELRSRARTGEVTFESLGTMRGRETGVGKTRFIINPIATLLREKAYSLPLGKGSRLLSEVLTQKILCFLLDEVELAAFPVLFGDKEMAGRFTHLLPGRYTKDAGTNPGDLDLLLSWPMVKGASIKELLEVFAEDEMGYAVGYAGSEADHLGAYLMQNVRGDGIGGGVLEHGDDVDSTALERAIASTQAAALPTTPLQRTELIYRREQILLAACFWEDASSLARP